MAWEKLGTASVGGAALTNTSWKLLGRGSPGSATLDTGTITAKDNLMVLIMANEGTQMLTYNGDSGSNYANKRSEEGGAFQNQTSQSNLNFTRNVGEDMFMVGNVINNASLEKLGVYHQTSVNNAGASNAPKRQEWAHKWTNTSDQITRVTLTSDSGSFASPDELVVLGFDNDEADSGTNFWQELADVELSSSGDTINSGTISAKKWLMYEVYVVPSGNTRTTFRFNSDSGSNYTHRNSTDGGSDSTKTSRTSIEAGAGDNDQHAYHTGFIVNVASKNKLMINHNMKTGGSGAGNAPSRKEDVAKWTNTSDAITSIQAINDQGGDYGAGSYMKVWGAD